MRSIEFEADLVVSSLEAATRDVVVVKLREALGHVLPSWEPGAHVDLQLPASRDGVLTRQYSLCGDPDDRYEWRLGILRDPESRGGSANVHDKLQPGDILRARGPRNNFQLQPSPRYLFIAGGIGITPILPMLASAHAAGADWRLVYGGRNRGSMAFIDELSGYGDRVSICPQDETGLLDLDDCLSEAREDTLVYCCGPAPLLAAVEDRCVSWPPASLHVERCSAAPGSPSEPSRSFSIELARSGRTLKVPSDRTILEVVEESGIEVPWSCGEGICGSCETDVLEGEPEHRDYVLSDEERAGNRRMIICVSRAVSERLVLDL